MGAGLNPYVILQGQQPQPIQNPIQLAEGVARVQQLQRQSALAPIQQAQAQQNSPADPTAEPADTAEYGGTPAIRPTHGRQRR